MTRQLLFTLALARIAAGLLDGIVEVVVTKEDVYKVPANLVAGVVDAAGEGDDGLLACATADAILSSCDARGVLETTAPVASRRNCLCCYSGTAAAPAYSSCASYVSNSLFGSDASTVYEAVSILASGCSAAGPGVCAGGGGGETLPTVSATRSSRPTAAGGAPAGCTSMISIYSSCSENMPGFETARARELAECFCYDRSGNYNTRFEDYASSCAPWVRTAAREDYSIISVFQTFCDDYPPVTSSTLKLTRVGSRTSGNGAFTEFAVTSSTTERTSTPTSRPTTTATADGAGTSSSSGALAAGPGMPGFVVSVANLATFVLSFFILI
ncbi:hypothetical protein VTK56DRAFT_7521 [Thermocarpiscus australiensis]